MGEGGGEERLDLSPELSTPNPQGLLKSPFIFKFYFTMSSVFSMIFSK